MTSFDQHSSLKREGTDENEDLSPDEKVICSLCEFQFSNEKLLTDHCNFCNNVGNTAGMDITTVKCEPCEEKTTELFDEHSTSEETLVMKVEEVELTETSVSGYSGTLSGQSIDPLKAEPPEEVLPSSKFDHASGQSMQLSQHVEARKAEQPYKCNICYYTTTQARFLNAHNQRHAREGVRCKVYMGRCATEKTPSRSHTGKKTFKCTLCDYAAVRSSHLTYHMQTHSGKKPFKCTVCDYAAVHTGKLTEHMRRHTGDKPFKCTFCDYTFSCNGNLERHIRVHTGEKPFKCALCDYSCTQSYSLTRHMRTHTCKKPLKCTLCNHTSAQHGDLIKHMRTHTGEKPFKCTRCDETFTRNAYLTRHMKKHTEERTF